MIVLIKKLTIYEFYWAWADENKQLKYDGICGALEP